MTWLWTILCNGVSCRPYNVGSEHDVTIAELANIMVRFSKSNSIVKIAKSPDPKSLPDSYIPFTKRAQMELGLRQTVNLEEAIRRTINFNLKIKNK
jgi:dTDP-glucose 4,6-dehydratase